MDELIMTLIVAPFVALLIWYIKRSITKRDEKESKREDERREAIESYMKSGADTTRAFIEASEKKTEAFMTISNNNMEAIAKEVKELVSISSDMKEQNALVLKSIDFLDEKLAVGHEERTLLFAKADALEKTVPKLEEAVDTLKDRVKSITERCDGRH